MTEKVSTLSLKTLIVPSKTVEVDFPGFDGFKVSIAYLSRETLINIRKKATKVSLKGRAQVEELNDELFLQLYAEAAIKGWSGFKLAYLEQLAPVELGNADLDSELEFTSDNAYFLMRNSSTFDSWVSEAVTDLGNFQRSNTRK